MAKKQDTPGHGIEYEILVPAFFALKLNNDAGVRDFSIRSNVSTEFGKLDDVVIDVVFQDDTTRHFAFQLKHREKKNKRLLPTSFEAKGDFNLEKYHEAFKQLQDDKKRYHFILYTNAQFDKNKCVKVEKYTMSQDEGGIGNEFFNTSVAGGNVYQFEVKSKTPNDSKQDLDEFLSKFRLYTCQKNFQDLEHGICDILRDKSVVFHFLNLFRKWHQGRFSNKVINRKTINIHLIDAFLSQFRIRNYYPKTQLFEKIITEFDISVMKNEKTELDEIYNFDDYFKNVSMNELEYGPDILKRHGTDQTSAINEWVLRMAKEYKLVEKTETNTDDETKLKVISYLLKKIIIIDFNENSKNLFCQTMELYNMKQINLKFLILVHDAELPALPNMRIFQNLEDVSKNNRVLYKKLVRTCKVLLHGREIVLEEFIKHFDKASSVIETNEILKMLQGQFLVREDRETLPPFYISRKVSTHVFNKETVFNYAKDTSNLILINFAGDMNQNLHVFRENGINIKKLEDYTKEETLPQYPVVLSTDDFSEKMFQDITEKFSGKNIGVYFLKTLSEDNFIITRSNKSIQELKPELKNDKMDEENLINMFNTSVNILVGQPGMGKSTMMKYLKNNCDWDMWTINVILQAHTSFFKKNHTTGEVLEYFISLTTNNTVTKKLVRLFENERKIVLFLDGLDELESACIDNVLRHVKTLSKMGFCIWISSREHLIEKLETAFGKFCMNIIELTKNEQQNYIQERLENHYTEEEIQNISQHIFQSYVFLKNQAILGIPLQLYIITQIFLDSEKRSLSFTKNMFVVTKLYKMFFEGRYQHEMRKNSSNTLFDDCEDYLQRYEIVALETLFKSEILLPLKLDSRQSQRLVRKIRTEKDMIGIIVSVNSEGKPIFQHHTFAEYFACVFFCNNFDKSRIVKDHLLSDKYQNLLLLLNMMLAENNPLHLAVIYKNVEQIQLHMESASHRDVTGRNPLHISVMHSNCRYATLSSRDSWPMNTLESRWFLLPEDLNKKPLESRDESQTNKNIIEQLVLQCDPFEKDLLFENDAFHCAVIKNNLFAIEKILKYKGMSRETYETLQRFGFVNNPTIAYYATLWAYPNLLSVALDKKYSLITMIIIVDDDWSERDLWSVLAHSKSNTLDKNETGLLMNTFGVTKNDASLQDAVRNGDLNLVKLFLDTSDKFSKDESVVYRAVISKNKRMVEYLLSKGFNVNGKYCHTTAMHAAVETEQLDMLKLLITRGGDINAGDDNNDTLLHYASKVGDIDITTFILIKGVNVNAINKNGKTALHIAVENNNIDIVRLLLKNGASLMENGDPYFYTPLQKAVLNGKYEMVCLLLQHKANEKIVSMDGTTVLHLAAEGGNVNIARLFLERNWSVNIENYVGATPLFFACLNRHLNMCKLLLRNDANVNIVTHLGDTLLHCAAEGGNCEILALLLQNNKNINAENNRGETPIYIAAKNNYIAAVKIFVEAGARINMETIRILLNDYHYYSYEDFEFLLKKMIEDGADPNRKCDQEDETLLSKVIHVENFELAQFLLERGANVNDIRAFRSALYCNEWKQFLELLFNKGFTLSSIQEYKFPYYLYRAYDIIKYLLDKGVPINIFNIFHDAVMGNNYQLVDLCLETEIDINVKQSDGRTALFNAASYRNFAMMKYLLEKGGDPNCKTNDGSTIWKQVIMYCNKDFLEYLLTKDIDLNSENMQGETPLYFALERNDQPIIQSLMNNGARFNNLKLLHKAVKMNNFLMVKMFFDINKKREAYIDGQIFLEACINGSCEIIDFLLKQGFKVNSVNDQNETALLLSAKNKKFEAVKLLVLREADVNCISKSRETIWKHIEYCEQNLKKLIYSRNVDLGLENEKKKTPLFYAIKNEDIFILEHLVKDKFIRFLDVMSISEANLCQNAHIVKILEENTDYRNVRKFQATQHSALNSCRIFDQFTTEINISEEEDDIKTNISEAQDDIYRKLHLAMYTGNVVSVEKLIDNLIDMDSVDIYNDQYPLHFAVNNGRLERDLLIQMTGKIGDLYCEFRRQHPRYKLRHMRRYLLNSYPVDQYFKQKRKQKYTYLFKKF